MEDKDFIKLLKQFRKEIHQRIGKEMCKELHADCSDCRLRWMIGLVNSEIDTLEWVIKNKL